MEAGTLCGNAATAKASIDALVTAAQAYVPDGPDPNDQVALDIATQAEGNSTATDTFADEAEAALQAAYQKKTTIEVYLQDVTHRNQDANAAKGAATVAFNAASAVPNQLVIL